jgi:hypothetical protein
VSEDGQGDKLWHANSRVLDGFYASEVHVVASDKSTAVKAAMGAYDAWLEEGMNQNYYHPLITSSYPNDSGFVQESKEKRDEFEAEMNLKLTPKESTGSIIRRC